MDRQLQTEIQCLTNYFERLMELYDKPIDSMEPFEHILLVTAKMAKLESLKTAGEKAPTNSVLKVIDSFTSEFYQGIEQELPHLMSAHQYSKANAILTDFKHQISAIRHLINPSAQTDAVEEMTDAERKAAEMRAAFGIR